MNPASNIYLSAEQQARRYIAAIRNPNTRHYAGLYWAFINGRTYQPDSIKCGISMMAAQAVRLHLLDIQEGQ